VIAAADAARIGVIVGMRSEAALLGPEAWISCSGGRSERAEQMAQAMLDQGAAGLISFGLAGGLDANLAPGALVIASAVDLGGASLRADEVWVRHLANGLPNAQIGVVCGVSEAVISPQAKHALHAESGGLVVDMESGAVAQVCAAAGKPFAVLRAVADPASRAIPEFALKGLDEEGRTRILPVLIGLARQPWALAGLIRLARDSRASLSSLRAAARLLGPTLGF
jgi:hopanoid-associated phosphorylase